MRHASFGELIRPFDLATEVYRVDRDMAPAPLGFLWLVKAVTALCGDPEWALRLVPLAASLAALALFARALSRWLDPLGRVLATALFALSPLQTLFAAELKPYTLDVLVALLLLQGCDAVRRAPEQRARWWRLSLLACVSVWLSFPAALVVAGGGSALCWREVAAAPRAARRILRALACAAALPALSFGLYWWVALRELESSEFLAQFWQSHFPQWPFDAAGRAFWSRVVQGISLLWGPLALEWLGLGVALVGALRLARSAPARLALLGLPILATLAVALLHLYPMQERLLLFWDPALALLLGAGLSFLIGGLLQLSRALALLAAAAILANPLGMHATLLRDPNYGYRSQEVREILAEVARARRPEDQLYVYYGASHAFGYYAARFGLDAADALHEPWRPGPALGRVLLRLDPARPVWAIFSQAYANEQQELQARLAQRRALLGQREAVRAAAFYYAAERARDAGPAAGPDSGGSGRLAPRREQLRERGLDAARPAAVHAPVRVPFAGHRVARVRHVGKVAVDERDPARAQRGQVARALLLEEVQRRDEQARAAAERGLVHAREQAFGHLLLLRDGPAAPPLVERLAREHEQRRMPIELRPGIGPRRVAAEPAGGREPAVGKRHVAAAREAREQPQPARVRDVARRVLAEEAEDHRSGRPLRLRELLLEAQQRLVGPVRARARVQDLVVGEALLQREGVGLGVGDRPALRVGAAEHQDLARARMPLARGRAQAALPDRERCARRALAVGRQLVATRQRAPAQHGIRAVHARLVGREREIEAEARERQAELRAPDRQQRASERECEGREPGSLQTCTGTFAKPRTWAW